MRRQLSLFFIPLLAAACAQSTDDATEEADVTAEVANLVAEFAPTELSADDAALPESERAALVEILKAAANCLLKTSATGFASAF